MDCLVNALPWAEPGELQNCFWRPINAANWVVPATINIRSSTGIGKGDEMLPRKGPYRPGGPQRGHKPLEEPSGPTGHRFICVLWAGGSLGSFLTVPLLTQTTDVVTDLSGANHLILVRLMSWDQIGICSI